MLGEIKVTSEDGTENIAPVTPADVLAFERHFTAQNMKMGLADPQFRVPQFIANPSIEQMWYLAYLAMKRLHKTGGLVGTIAATFDGFVETLADVELVDEVPLDETTSLSE